MSNPRPFFPQQPQYQQPQQYPQPINGHARAVPPGFMPEEMVASQLGGQQGPPDFQEMIRQQHEMQANMIRSRAEHQALSIAIRVLELTADDSKCKVTQTLRENACNVVNKFLLACLTPAPTG